MPFALYYAFVGAKAAVQLFKFGQNMAAGILHSETLGYIRLRIYMVNLIFLEFLVMVIAYAMFAFMLKRWTEGSFDEKKQVDDNARNVASVARTGAFFLTLFLLFINYALGGWCQQTLGRSIIEANDVLGGNRSDLKRNQVL